ncbi:MAG: hypothetical protein KAT34_06640 [Candidatus Aminicenantes bacterium]|nr:hypothetical protein [Candidatus Aminicenantes bacterium]
MRIFDRKGMLIIPSPEKKIVSNNKKMMVVKECFCQNGHNLISNHVRFKGFDGIFLKIAGRGKEGFLGISPIFGDECHISMGLDVVSGEIPQYMCPVCDVNLPVYSICSCGAGIITLFANAKANFSNCIGICSRYDCFNSSVISNGELLSPTMINCSEKKSGLSAYEFPH